ncbi:MAG TPA: MIP/aquaporin family protein [Opitutales bacterium]|nr:MIP/aquaporin family protein [Opitutales bacterium]
MKVDSRKPWLPAWLVGEVAGTFLLVFFGCGCVATATLCGAQVGAFQVAIIWGLGIAIAIQLTGGLSGAHLNPAVTVALAAWDGFPWKKVPLYLLAQLAGAFAASAVLYLIYSGVFTAFESAHGIVRGAPGSEASAMVFGEFFPNPGGKPLPPASVASVTWPTAFLTETVGAAILLLVILCVSNERNRARPVGFAPVMIGLTITILISLMGPLTMACFNPARDFAPRLFSSLAGWGGIPFTANGNGWFTVYIAAPFFGGWCGGGIYRWFFKPHFQLSA